MYKRSTFKVGDRVVPFYNLLEDVKKMKTVISMKEKNQSYLYITEIIGLSEVFVYTGFGFKNTLLIRCNTDLDGKGELFTFHGLDIYKEDVEKTPCVNYTCCAKVGGCKGEIHECYQWIPGGHLISVSTMLCEIGRDYYENEYGIIVSSVNKKDKDI